MTRKKRMKSKEEELWQEMKERGEDKKLTSADLVEIIRKSSRQCFQKKVFEKLAELVLVKEGVAQSRLFLLIKYALEKEIPWLVKGSWGLLKKSYPTKETLIFIVKYVD